MAVMLAGRISSHLVVLRKTDSGSRRRKVRCNEQKPRCSHCERLNLECTWHRPSTQRNVSSTAQFQSKQLQQSSLVSTSSRSLDISEYSAIFNSTWDEAMLLSPSSWPNYSMAVPFDPEPFPQSIGATWPSLPLTNPTQDVGSPRNSLISVEVGVQGASTGTQISSDDGASSMENEYLLDSFLQIFMPPILVPVEVGPKLATTRAFFASMSSKSSMVKLAVMAFSALQLSRSQNAMYIDYQPFYDRASQELRRVLAAGTLADVRRQELEHLLAAIFLLTYADVSATILERSMAECRSLTLSVAPNREVTSSAR